MLIPTTLSLLSLLVQAPAPTPTPSQTPTETVATDHLSAQLLVGHPGLMLGDIDRVRADWLEALGHDLHSPLAAVATARLLEMDPFASEGLPPARLAELIEGSDDGDVALGLKRLFLRELQRSRFTDQRRPLFRDDLFDDWMRHFRVLGPVGPLDHPAPFRAIAAEPEVFSGRLLDPVNGLPLQWLPLERQSNQWLVSPDRLIDSGQGSLFLTTAVQAAPGLATLELQADESLRVWWNHTLVLDGVRRGLTDSEEVHRLVVDVRDGWNRLTVQSKSGDYLQFAARLLDREGHLMSYQEWDQADAWPAIDEQAGAPALALTPPTPEGRDPWSRILAVAMARLDHRPDRALAIPAPTEMSDAQRLAWLLARHDALMDAFHLPAEVDLRQRREIEGELSERGWRCLPIQLRQVRDLLDEDQREQAATTIAAIAEAYPQRLSIELMTADVLRALDASGTLAKPVLEATTAAFPHHPGAWSRLAELAEKAGDHLRQAEALRAAARVGDGSASDWIDFLNAGNPEQQALAAELIERVATEEPASPGLDEQRYDLALAQGDIPRMQRLVEQRLEASPDRDWLQRREANIALRAGDAERARSILAKLLERSPGDFSARRQAQWLGMEDPSEAFFSTFAPDAEAARTATPLDDSANLSKLLDSGMIYLWPDGSYRYRVHDLTLAQTRRGTEALHELPDLGDTRLAVVHQADGGLREPHVVDDNWVMPDLNPGDEVEMVYDRDHRGTPGLAPEIGGWFFQSRDQDFLLSRLAIFIPEGLPGELVEHAFDGEHEVIPWQGGEVHVFTRANSRRLEPEPAMPSDHEVLPWVDYGIDLSLDQVAAHWRDWYDWQSAVPADIEVELRAFLEALALPADPLERAKAIFTAVDERTLDFMDSGDVTDVWTLKRGNPTGLMLALLRLAEVPVAPAVSTSTADRLNEDPARPFPTADRFDLPLLALPPDADGRPTWLLLTTRGQPFGQLPLTSYGAEVMVLEADGERLEHLPAFAEAAEPAVDLSLDYRLQRDDSALVEGRMSIGGAEGAAVREQLSQLSDQQLEQAMANFLASIVPGVQLDGGDFTALDQRGGSLGLTFHGRLPDFILHRGDKVGVRLQLLQDGMSGMFGSGERSQDLVVRERLRAKIELRLHGDGAWLLDYGPESAELHAEGFDYLFQVDKSETELHLLRDVTLDGLHLPAAEVADFTAKLHELEQEQQRAVRLFPVPVAEVEPEASTGEAPTEGDQ